jgi:hypothetical protein
MQGVTADSWRVRACGLLVALDVASIAELAGATGLSFETVAEAAQEFESRDGGEARGVGSWEQSSIYQLS